MDNADQSQIEATTDRAPSMPTPDMSFAHRIKLAEIVAVAGAALSIISAGVSFWQAGIAREQTTIARDSLNDERRARAPKLDGKDVNVSPVVMDGQQVSFLSGVWINSGQSATENLRRSGGCGATPDEARRNQVFATATTPIAPGSTQMAGGCGIKDKELNQHLEDGTPIFLAAEASYADRFGANYTDKLCYAVIFRKNRGFVYNKNSTVTYQDFSCDSFKCTKGRCSISDATKIARMAETQ